MENERAVFFREMQHNGASCIILGDFNIKLCVLDKNEDEIFRTDASRKILRDFMLEKNWCDLWRNENPITRTYSRQQTVKSSLRRSRIDLCLIKQKLIQSFHTARYNFTHLSDHAFLLVNLGKEKRGKGGGLWHLNAKLLENENYKKCISNVINTVSSQPTFKNAAVRE